MMGWVPYLKVSQALSKPEVLYVLETLLGWNNARIVLGDNNTFSISGLSGSPSDDSGPSNQTTWMAAGEQTDGDEQPPRVSAWCRPGIGACLLRSTFSLGGCRSSFSFGRCWSRERSRGRLPEPDDG